MKQQNANNNNNKTSLSTRAMLVNLKVSQWTGRKLDKAATKTVSKEYKTKISAGTYHKKLLPDAAELNRIHAEVTSLRKYFYEQTLPWFSDGTRIISSRNYFSFVAEIKNRRAKFESAVNDFAQAYPQLRKDAASSLGDLFNKEEYPDDISSKFLIDISFMPLPDVQDFRVQISESEKTSFAEKLKEVETQATKDACSRMLNVLSSATEKLKDPKSIFRNSLIENIEEMAKILPMLNISENAEIDKAASDILYLVKNISADVLRDNETERTDAVAALQDCENKMKAFMGEK